MEGGFVAAGLMSSAMDSAGTEAGELAAAHGMMADEVVEDSEAIRTARQEAWVTFAEDVRTAVGAALEAYRTGNAEMLAEQQKGLAQMLWNQTDTMLLLGQVTEEQAAAMKLAIGDQFGIVVDEVGLTTDALLGMFADWAAGGGTSAHQIMNFLLGIGSEAEALATKEEATTRRMIEEWRYRSTGVTEYGGVIAAAVDEMSNNVEGDIAGIGQEFETTAFKIGFV